MSIPEFYVNKFDITRVSMSIIFKHLYPELSLTLTKPGEKDERAEHRAY